MSVFRLRHGPGVVAVVIRDFIEPLVRDAMFAKDIHQNFLVGTGASRRRITTIRAWWTGQFFSSEDTVPVAVVLFQNFYGLSNLFL